MSWSPDPHTPPAAAPAPKPEEVKPVDPTRVSETTGMEKTPQKAVITSSMLGIGMLGKRG